MPVDAVVTDPPYGIGHVPSEFWKKQRIAGDEKAFDPRPFLAYTPSKAAIFGANHFAHLLPPTNGWVIWDKRDQVSRGLPGSDAELVWTTAKQTRIFRHVWLPHTLRDEPPYHPTQKPTPLLRFLIELIDGQTVLDPFMGSGTTLRAAKDLGRKAIGIEIEERYCEIVAKRCAQEVLSLT